MSSIPDVADARMRLCVSALERQVSTMLGTFVSPQRVRTLVTAADRQDRPWMELAPQPFAESYLRGPFGFRHRLDQHPLFTLDALFALCRRMPEADVKLRFGPIPATAEFDTSLDRFRQGLTLDDALANFEARRAYIAIYNPERDAAYEPVIEGLLGEIARRVEPLDPGVNWYSSYVFVSTQGSVTPYHMDREMNFLMQVRGRKTVRLWDPTDPQIMTAPQKDKLMGNRDEQRPTYRPEFEAKARIFELGAGDGVHHPFIAPHLVTTDSALSVTLAITYRTARSDLLTDAHTLNHRLRRLGLQPSEVGLDGRRDRLKAATWRAARRVVQAARAMRSRAAS